MIPSKPTFSPFLDILHIVNQYLPVVMEKYGIGTYRSAGEPFLLSYRW